MRILTFLYTAYLAFVFVFFMLLFLPLIVLPLFIKREGNRLSYMGLWLWASTFRYLSGVRYCISGKENLPKHRSFILISNHTSYLDIPALPLLTGGPFKPLAKRELVKVPVFGAIVRVVTVTVNRRDAASRKSSLLRLKRALKGGTSLVIYPEGTVNKTGAPLAPFYDGAFRMAIETQAELVPVVVSGAKKLMPPRSILARPGRIELQILPPVSAEGLGIGDVPELKTRIFEQMETAVLHGRQSKQTA
jgi:1-acyl-sn-glycerol-3-phosphate acyltransferase